MILLVFNAGRDRMLVVQCVDQLEASSAWSRLYEFAIAHRVSSKAVRVWIQAEREYLSWFKIAEAASQLGDPESKPPRQD